MKGEWTRAPSSQQGCGDGRSVRQEKVVRLLGEKRIEKNFSKKSKEEQVRVVEAEVEVEVEAESEADSEKETRTMRIGILELEIRELLGHLLVVLMGELRREV